MRTAIYFFYGLDVEIRPKMDPPELFIHLGGAIGTKIAYVSPIFLGGPMPWLSPLGDKR